jgi:two-component system, NtrC family, sensor histidine kinase GlrK
MPPLRLATRLGITHGVLAFFALVLLVATLPGLVRIIGLVSAVRDGGLSSIDAEESLHRAAWAIEVAVRHGRAACAEGGADESIRRKLETSRVELVNRREARADLPQALLVATASYRDLADAAVKADTCAFLLLPETDALRARLDEDLTNAWIDRLHYVHSNIQRHEDAARQIGVRTALIGVVVALFGAVAAAIIARTTARSVTDPIAQLAREATRVGEGDFRPIPAPRGPREIEELWRDLDLMRGRLQELDQLKTAFLANVSHELRSPLTRVRAALSLLSDGTCGDLTDRQGQVVSLASRACEREVRIVTALLDMSRLESGLPLKLESGAHIDRVLSAVVEDERVDAAERGVRLEVEASGDVPAVEIDSALVERALANLVRNAVSVSTSGQVVRITRRLQDSPETPKAVAIEIIDQGPGLPDEVREAAFRPFAATAIGAVGRPAGIGLGLSLAHEVANAHGGTLTLVRSGKDGTVFHFELPLTRRHDAITG